MRRPRRIRRPARALFGAVLLGVGTLFQPKARLDEHWSTSPRVEVIAETEADDAGGPPSGGPGARHRTLPAAA